MRGREIIGCSVLDVRCSMFPLIFHFEPFLASRIPLGINAGGG
jgi:hypothetical protein